MTPPIPWFQREFPSDTPLGIAPNIVERLRGTPARLDERLRGIPEPVLVRRHDEHWSIQENAGHLWDLESLWLIRIDDLTTGRTELTQADLTNRKTSEGEHNTRPLSEILAGFREARAELVARLEHLDTADWARTSLHPRLKTPMRVLDFAIFVAEHDDHHLATITTLLRAG